MSEEVSILCTGDIHIGRHPTRIPTDVDGPSFSPKAIWQATVEEAIDRGVDAVVVTGDVVDRENRYFEAYGAFEEGATRLDEAAVPLVAVSGNHDFDVFPRMADDLDLDHFRFLGGGGEWERWTLGSEEGSDVHFDGWSFPDQYVLNSPVDDYDLSNPEEGAHLGVLHADLDSGDSEYAPVKSSDLRGASTDVWLLGHIHSPTVHDDATPPILYPGSPQPLDPGEPRSHGPWLLTFDGTGLKDATQLSLASVRYDSLAVDVSEVDDPKSVPPLVSEQVREHVHAEVDTGSLELLLAKVRLTGRTGAHGDLVEQRHSIPEQLELKEGSLPVRIETLEIDTRPEVDLEEHSGADTPTGYLADLLLAIEDDQIRDERPGLVEEALDAMQRARGASAFSLLRQQGAIDRPDEEAAVERLERQARLLLEELVEQKGDPT